MGPESNTAPEMVFTLSFLYPFLNPWLHPMHPRFFQNFQVEGSPEVGLFIGKTLISNLQKGYKNGRKNSSILFAKINQLLIICSIHTCACAIRHARTPCHSIYTQIYMYSHLFFLNHLRISCKHHVLLFQTLSCALNHFKMATYATTVQWACCGPDYKM